MTDQSPAAPVAQNAWQKAPTWLPLFISFMTIAGGFLGGVVAAQVRAAHTVWVEEDHERRIITLEADRKVLYSIDGRLNRIEGALGVKGDKP